jgi:CHAT domain-containing protein/tetratricopeptide (TPR) repeat protein
MTMPEADTIDRTTFAARLAAAGDEERAALLSRHAALADVELARALKALYDDTKVSEPARANSAASAITLLTDLIDDSEAHALAYWTAGMAALQLEGQMEQALALLDKAIMRFEELGQPQIAAAAQVSRLHALAMLGRYDEAIECGLWARDVFLAHGDILAAGKIEQNLGNIYFRRDNYDEAEQHYSTARAHFLLVGDQKELAKASNNLANVLSLQHKFRAATLMYEQALARAATGGLEITQAEIECNMGCFAFDQADYRHALDYLEQSRRRYAVLGMPHESATVELELADAYLELNLAPEAVTIYSRVIPTFAELGMRAEQARALANHGRACLLLGRNDPARSFLSEARELYAAEGNAVGEALVTLTEVQLDYRQGDYAAAASAAARAAAPLAAARTWGRLLLARWLHGESIRMLGREREARALLESALREAGRRSVPQVARRCHTSLGLLAETAGDFDGAEAAFQRAIALIEELRAPLPAEEFRAAFVADKLTPYTAMARLCLASEPRAAEALGYVERSRARALVEMLGGALRFRPRPRDSFEAELLGRMAELHEELSWFYSQINRSPDSDAPRSPAAMEELYTAARERESRVLEITRQIQQRSLAQATGEHHAVPPSLPPPPHMQSLDVAGLQRDLGPDTALVEYFSLDGELLAFVVTNEGVEVVRRLGRENQVEAVVRQLRFQIDALRYGAEHLRAHMDQLTLRARHYLRALYNFLLRPIEARLGARRLVVVPHRTLHYVPFHALCDEKGYVIERREVCCVPSAAVLRHCLARPRGALRRALLLGVADAQTPRVRDEVAVLAPLFHEPVALLDGQATLAELRARAPAADVLHLACHGYFRPDNPQFSSLRLADGWLTVRDAYDLDLTCGLATLSACETGVSAVAPGDELIGLARGFFSAGAPALLVSLWRVDDHTTAELMASFYRRLREGDGPAAALRHAQRELLEHHPHPFFWSPFVLLGRW